MRVSESSLESGLREVLAGILPPSNGGAALGLHDSLRSAGLDSLRTVELISAIELRFDVQFSEDDLRDEYFATLAGLIRGVRLLKGTE